MVALTISSEDSMVEAPCNGFRVDANNLRFRLRNQKTEYLKQHNEQHHRTVLLSSLHLNDHTLGFLRQTQKLEPRSLHDPLQ